MEADAAVKDFLRDLLGGIGVPVRVHVTEGREGVGTDCHFVERKGNRMENRR